MNKTIFKILISFIASAVVISLILLSINFLAFAITASDTSNLNQKSPVTVLDEVAKHLNKTDSGFAFGEEYSLSENLWAILIDETGNVIWQEHKPADIPEHYTINDVASMTKWFLNDYPVYMRTLDEGLLVLGYPKNTVGKYQMEYSMEWFSSLPTRLMAVLLFNAVLATVLALCFGLVLYRRLKELVTGIRTLKQEEPTNLKEKGIFKELAKSVNETSVTIGRKNALLKQQDDARANWIAGISHDIRTPLSIIMGYSEELFGSLKDENKQKQAEIIMSQSLKIKTLVEDLNLISSLEYDMQPAKKKQVKICSLLRETVSEILNEAMDEKVNIELDLTFEKAAVVGDERLLKRAVFNLIHNAVCHNKSPCTIQIIQKKEESMCVISIRDNGAGVDPKVLEQIGTIPKSAHGLGLPMAYKIVQVHGGVFNAYNDGGFCVEMKLPLAQ